MVYHLDEFSTVWKAWKTLEVTIHDPKKGPILLVHDQTLVDPPPFMNLRFHCISLHSYNRQ